MRRAATLIVCLVIFNHAGATLIRPAAEYSFIWAGAFGRRVHVDVAVMADGTSHVSTMVNEKKSTKSIFAELTAMETSNFVLEIEQLGIWTASSWSPCANPRGDARWGWTAWTPDKEHSVERCGSSDMESLRMGTLFINVSGLKSYDLY